LFVDSESICCFLKAVNSKNSQKYWTSIRYQQVRISKKEACRRVLSEKRFKLPSRRATRPEREPMAPEGPPPINIHCPTTSIISVFLCKICLDRKNIPYNLTHQKKSLINNYQSIAEKMK
jgi:hypothetical protein